MLKISLIRAPEAVKEGGFLKTKLKELKIFGRSRRGS